MKSTAKSMPILILSLGLVASCTTPTASDPCAGWSFIDGQDASLVFLATHDPQFLRAVIAHDEFGAKIGCWK